MTPKIHCNQPRTKTRYRYEPQGDKLSVDIVARDGGEVRGLHCGEESGNMRGHKGCIVEGERGDEGIYPVEGNGIHNYISTDRERATFENDVHVADEKGRAGFLFASYINKIVEAPLLSGRIVLDTQSGNRHQMDPRDLPVNPARPRLLRAVIAHARQDHFISQTLFIPTAAIPSRLISVNPFRPTRFG
jgi:hypothetical protein